MKKSKFDISGKLREMRSTELNLEPAKKLLAQINQIDLSEKDDQFLRNMSADLKSRAMKGEKPEEMLTEAFALAREAAARTVGMRPFDVQVLAGIALHYGALVEMQTGEGKTLAATAPVYLNSLYGKGIHVLTFNDYLAKRDALWMGPLYDFLGVHADYVREGMSKERRKQAYAADITYLTAKEAGFDYLRSFLTMSPSDLVQRPFNFAIVDEADSILIDEARVPLVIAGKTRKGHGTDPVQMARIVSELVFDDDYSLDENERNVFLTEKGVSKIEESKRLI